MLLPKLLKYCNIIDLYKTLFYNFGENVDECPLIEHRAIV